MDKFYYLSRLLAFGMAGLLLGLKATMMFIIWQTRHIHYSPYGWLMRAGYFGGHALIWLSYIFIMNQRIETKPPFNWPAFVSYYIAAISTTIFMVYGIRSERRRYRFAKNGAWAEGEGPEGVKTNVRDHP